jgi:SAM-dependent methyltransferase
MKKGATWSNEFFKIDTVWRTSRPAKVQHQGGSMTNISDWEGAVGKSWSHEWERTDRSFAALTPVLVQRILDRGAAHSILDIGCGAGELTLAIAPAKPESRILGVDISEDLIEIARARGAASDRMSFLRANAAHWSDAQFKPDLLISRHGVMFFDDPVMAFQNLVEASAPGARFVFSCFRDRSENDWATRIGRLLPTPSTYDPQAPGPFAFADSTRVKAILEESGWDNVRHEAVDFDYVAGTGDNPVDDTLSFFSRIGPAAPVIRALKGEEQAALLSKLRTLAEDHLIDGDVRFAAAAWIVTATRAN